MDQAELAIFLDSCEFELCEMGTDDKDAICGFAEAFADRCKELEIPTVWRDKEFCG